MEYIKIFKENTICERKKESSAKREGLIKYPKKTVGTDVLGGPKNHRRRNIPECRGFGNEDGMGTPSPTANIGCSKKTVGTDVLGGPKNFQRRNQKAPFTQGSWGASSIDRLSY